MAQQRNHLGGLFGQELGSHERVLKLLLLGDTGVGKSSLLRMFVDKEFNESFFTATVGMDFKMRPHRIDDVDVRLQIWDTAGQERFRTIIKQYYRGANGILVVFDVNSADSFKNVSHWLNEIEEHCIPGKVEILLVGNKCDVADEYREVSYEEAAQRADELGIAYVETSSLDEEQVTQVFEELAARAFVLSRLQNPDQFDSNVSLRQPEKPQDNCIC